MTACSSPSLASPGLAASYRRIVTGLDDAGRSCVMIAGPLVGMDNENGGYVWRSAAVPADNSGREDTAPDRFDYDFFHDGGSNFLVIEMAPGTRSSTHATDTIDYIVMIAGRVVLELDTGEVALNPGDLLVDRGVLHTWRNDGAEPAAYAVITLPAHPVGKGRTV